LVAISFPRTEEVDRVVTTAASDFLGKHISTPFAVLGVGGYGRRELFPFSDVDLLVLLEREPDAQLKEPLSQFLRVLWDSSVKASHSVRTIDECCQFHENNIHLSISLLDLRFICGNPELLSTLATRLPEFFKHYSRPLLRGLSDLTTSRHSKFGSTVYHLEPNIKESPGGVRDIHFLQWAAQLAPEKEPLRHAAAEISDARQFLYRLRFFLHERSGRDNNLLSFELQDEAAEALPAEPLTPEEWMREYYRHARSCFQPSVQALEFISRSEVGLVRQFFDRRDRLSTSEFTVAHNRVLLRNPAATLSSLTSLFGLFTFAGHHGIPLSWDAERRVRERVRSMPQQPGQEPRWSDWRRLLEQPHAALALHNMQDCGVLATVLPQWKSIDSLVVRDFYHRYTVDEHTLVAIQSIDDLLTSKEDGLARFRQLALEDDNLPALRMALLLHDIGKGITPGDHVLGSCQTATEFLTAIGTPEAERQAIQFLIAHHLDLSLVMNGRDLDDPATGRFLSSQIGTYEDLRKLTLLTYADVSAVNPTAMTPWRAEQLWRVYLVAAAQLTRELASQRISQSADATVTASVRPELARFLEGFPTRYRRIHSASQIEEHFRLEQLRLRDGVALQIQREPGAYAMTVLAADQPGLFAALCGTLASFGMNIVKAEAASNSSGCALDELRFTDPARTLELNPDEVERLRWTVECVIKGVIEVSDLLKRRRVKIRPAASRKASTILFDNLASDSSTLLNFSGEDRPGLLFDLASALTAADCNIEVVLVNTEGHQAIDVLYLTHNGGKLDSATEEDVQARLASCI
jgi:[protein-PII] uridylyltransferase